MTSLSPRDIHVDMTEEHLSILKENILEAFRKCHDRDTSMKACFVIDAEVIERIDEDDLFLYRMNDIEYKFRIKMIERLETLSQSKIASIALSATDKLLKMHMPDKYSRGGGGSDGKGRFSEDPVPSHIDVEGVENEEEYADCDPEDIELPDDDDDDEERQEETNDEDRQEDESDTV